MKKKIKVDVSNVDWKLLREQKTLLLEIQNDFVSTSEKYLTITGIVNLIDDIQDQAAEVIGEDEVFGETYCGEKENE